jgi:hypothetical protein
MGANGAIDSIARYLACYHKEDPPCQETTAEPSPDSMGFYRVESDTVDAKCFDCTVPETGPMRLVAKSTMGSDARLVPGALIHINDRNLFSAIEGLDKVDSLAGSCLHTRWLASE